VQKVEILNLVDRLIILSSSGRQITPERGVVTSRDQF